MNPMLFPAVAAALALATLCQQDPQSPAAGLDPLPAGEFTPARARHLLCRAGFGGSAAEVERLCALGLHAAVDELVDFHLQPAGPTPLAFARDVPSPADLRQLTAEERRARVDQRNRTDRRQLGELRQWWLGAMATSPRPLQEKLVLFWHGHFAAEYRTVRDAVAMQAQNDLFRRHAAGSFKDLLHGIAHDAAMLRYLDADRNVKGKPNENLAREIMELFAMGEGQGYTEADIREGARALTGATFDRRSLEYRFRPAQHDDGQKHLFGREGRFGPDDFVDLILQQPAAARHVAGRLFAFFAYPEPDAADVDSLAATLRSADYQLAPMLKRLFRSRAFYSDRALGTRIKSPAELMVGAVRMLGLQDVDWRQVDRALAAMGQQLFDPPNVRGWIEGEAWIDTNRILVRHNSVAALLRQQQRALANVVPTGVQSAEQALAVLEPLLLARPLSTDSRARLLESLAPAAPGPRLFALVLLLTTLPEYQLT
jgi:uncharacterized protein (DUF1800 family)